MFQHIKKQFHQIRTICGHSFIVYEQKVQNMEKGTFASKHGEKSTKILFQIGINTFMS